MLTLVAAEACSQNNRAVALADACYKDRDAPPFPGTSNPSEILENIRYAVWRTPLGGGIEAFYEPDAVVLQRVIEVEEPRSGNYFIAEVRTKDHEQFWVFEMRKQTGRMMMGGSGQRTDRSWLTSIPTLESVAPALERRFGAQGAHYFCPPYNNLTPGQSVDMPFIAARSPRGRIMVSTDLKVFEEVGFEVDPPGLSPQARLERLQQRGAGRLFIQTDDSVMWLKEVGRLDK